MRLNDYGKIVDNYWNKIPEYFSNVRIDMFVVMPNHTHGIILITDDCRGGVSPPLQKRTLGQIVAFLKYQTTTQINEILKNTGLPVWQRNYYEHVIRNEDKLNKIRQYIQFNPLKWHLDRENPERTGADWLEDEIFVSKIKTKAKFNAG